MSSQKDETLLAGYTYAYSLDGNIVEKNDNKGITTSYVYDNAGMLSVETVSSPYEQIQHTQYAYDNRGNRTSATGVGGDEYSENYTYDLNNRLTKTTKVSYNEYEHPVNVFSTLYNYDFNGNLFSENTSAIGKSLDNPSITMNLFGMGDDNWNHEVGLTVYNFNLNNQLTSVEKDGKSATYTYNPDGYRSSKTVDGVTTNHIWNGSQIAAETNSDDSVKALYIYGTKRIYNEQDNVKSYYLYDAHGDTKQLTNAFGAVTYDYTYDAFGNEVESDYGITVTNTTITEPYNPFRYCGEYCDVETGFIYLRARYYSPETGRFVSEDPHWNSSNMIYGDKEYKDSEIKVPDINAIMQSNDLYIYCMNNPLLYADRNGLDSAALAGNIFFDGWKIGGSLMLSDGAFWGGDIAGLLVGGGCTIVAGGLLLISGIDSWLDDSKSESKAESAVISDVESKKLEDIKIYRSGSDSFYNLTPTKNKDENGLSYFLVPPHSGTYTVTTLQAVNDTNVLIATIDGPNHVSVKAKFRHIDWIESKENANTNPHVYTLVLYSISTRIKIK